MRTIKQIKQQDGVGGLRAIRIQSRERHDASANGTPAQIRAPLRMSFETFRRPGSYEQSNLTQSAPYCFNGLASIRKYRVVIEEIEEPAEVLAARLRELWFACDNIHHIAALRQLAAELGVELAAGERGKNCAKMKP